MKLLVISVSVWAVFLFISLFVGQKIKNYKNKINLFWLIILTVLSILMYDKINNHDIKMLYSLGLIIASGIGRYGTELTKKRKKSELNQDYFGVRQIIYSILFISGLVGLLS